MKIYEIEISRIFILKKEKKKRILEETISKN